MGITHQEFWMGTGKGKMGKHPFAHLMWWVTGKGNG